MIDLAPFGQTRQMLGELDEYLDKFSEAVMVLERAVLHHVDQLRRRSSIRGQVELARFFQRYRSEISRCQLPKSSASHRMNVQRCAGQEQSACAGDEVQRRDMNLGGLPLRPAPLCL